MIFKYNKYIREVFGEDSLYAERLDDLAAGVPAQQELYPQGYQAREYLHGEEWLEADVVSHRLRVVQEVYR